MVRGLYTAYTGMKNEQYRLDVITNNLANSATTGYKKEGATSQAFSEVLGVKINDSSEAYLQRNIGKMSLGVKIGETYTDYSQGGAKITGNTYDVMLGSNGFFAIQMTDKNGNQHVRYTRDGSFTVTKDGYLVTKDGDSVLNDQGQPIQITNPSGTVSIDLAGNIAVDGTTIDKIGVFDFEDYDYLSKYGENMYDAVDGATFKTSDASVMQGYLETSNVNVVSEMVNMITITRAYEANQKMITTIDSTLDKAVNSVGRV